MLKDIFINQNGNHNQQQVFANEKEVCLLPWYKICASGFDKLLESILCILLALGAFSLQGVGRMHDDKEGGWQEAR